MRIDYVSLQGSYAKRGMTDMPSAITSIRMGGGEKTVRHYYGNKFVPSELKQLENRIDEIAGSARRIEGIQ